MKRFSKTVVVILVILIFITALWAWKGELLPGGLPRFLPQKETAEETESLTASEESVDVYKRQGEFQTGGNHRVCDRPGRQQNALYQ